MIINQTPWYDLAKTVTEYMLYNTTALRREQWDITNGECYTSNKTQKADKLVEA